MNTKLNAGLKTLWKYLFWTAIAAIATGLANHLAGLAIPDIYVPLIGAILKSIATYAATEGGEY